METVLGLIGIALFIVAVIALAAGVTYLVIRLTPSKAAREPSESS